MTLYAIVTILLLPIVGRSIAKNPHSIAVTWSLIAESKMLEKGIIPRGSEWCDNKELKAKGVFEGITFTLDGEENGRQMVIRK
jgi:hypothetical protein